MLDVNARFRNAVTFLCLAVGSATGSIVSGDIFRWDNGEVILGTEGITPGPGVHLNDRELEYARLDNINLTGADFTSSNLTSALFNGSTLINAEMAGANLTNATLLDANLINANLINANLAGAIVIAADLRGTTRRGFNKEQLYSTASYQEKNLRSIRLGGYQLGIGSLSSNLTLWDLSGQDLTDADLSYATLTNTSFIGATVNGTRFTQVVGLTKEQLYATASYQQRNLQGIVLNSNYLTGWDFHGQDLKNASFESATLMGADLTGADFTNASFESATLADANLAGAIVTGANFLQTTAHGFTKEQLYSTASYQHRNLQGITFGEGNMLTGWDFSGQDLTDAYLSFTTLIGANLSGAIVNGTRFTQVVGLTKEQLYATASYKQRNLQGIALNSNDLTGWDFSSQDLTNAEFSGSTMINSNLATANLANADLNESKLTNANLADANLTSAVLSYSTLTNADLTNAIVTGAHFNSAVGFTKEQLYSTASYRQKDLQGIRFGGGPENGTDLTGWNLNGQDLTSAEFWFSTLADANLTGANVSGVVFTGTTDFTKEQLYSTASYEQKNLRGIALGGIKFFGSIVGEHDLSGWDLSGQDLTNASLAESSLSGTKLAGTIVAGANFYGTTSRGFTKEQLYSTASYQQKNLRGIDLGQNDLTGWGFHGQDLRDANLYKATLFDASLNATDLRGAKDVDLTGAIARNAIRPDGTIMGMDLASRDELVVRDDDGLASSLALPWWNW